ncbi:SsrA-binding protein SmpB [Chloroflexota bacterium]
MSIKNIATNRKALHKYFILEAMEAGIALTGSEIKSIRSGRVSLGEAYVRLEGGELWLINAHIARYEAASHESHESTRRRKLLVHRREMATLAARTAEKGFTLVALKLYLKGRIAKLEVGVAKGKKLYDKREAIMRRESQRELGRIIKRRV